MAEYMCPVRNNEISNIGMRAKILDLVGLNIKEIVIDLNVSNRAFILTTDGSPTCTLEKNQMSSIELAYLDGIAQISSQEFIDRVKLVKKVFYSTE